jgi:hypothetical protein
MFGSITGREFAIVFVIALLALGGSQLPRLVRALTARHESETAGPDVAATPVDPTRKRAS